MTKKPHADTPLAQYIERRVLELKPKKSQGEIASEAGFPNPNMVTMIKNGTSKLALDRVPSMARALECDPAYLMRLALEQAVGDTAAQAIEDIYGTPIAACLLSLHRRNQQINLHGLQVAREQSVPSARCRQRPIAAVQFAEMLHSSIPRSCPTKSDAASFGRDLAALWDGAAARCAQILSGAYLKAARRLPGHGSIRCKTSAAYGRAVSPRPRSARPQPVAPPPYSPCP